MMDMRQNDHLEAKRDRPTLPEEYGIPANEEGILPWEWVVERVLKARNYWVSTTRADGRPHAVPVWAAWVGGKLYFDGHPQTQWGRNIAGNPAVCVHLESGDEVVILEGVVEDIPHLDRTLAEEVAGGFTAKYSEPTASVDELVGRGIYALRL